MKFIEGGVCAAKGFVASGIHCGIRKNKLKRDLALILGTVECNAASVYTTNLVKGAPIIVTQNNIDTTGKARAIICNSGNANTCNSNGIEIANEMCKLLSQKLGIDSKQVIVASTGVIGQPLSIEPIKQGLDELIRDLGNHSHNANEAIMTTDTFAKEVAVTFSLGNKTCTIGGISKGSGMIHPNMATMLAFLTTDVSISAKMLKKALLSDVADSFNMLSVDGDTSTNDMVSILASGQASNDIIDKENDDYFTFCKALKLVTVTLTKLMAKDGEGATKMLECVVTNAKNTNCAKIVAKSVITSSLLKTAMFGADANWGRILCAIGYSKADVDVDKINVSFASNGGEIDVCKKGKGLDFSEEMAKTVLKENEIIIKINLNDGNFNATAWGCDLTYDYVKINGDYRT